MMSNNVIIHMSKLKTGPKIKPNTVVPFYSCGEYFSGLECTNKKGAFVCFALVSNHHLDKVSVCRWHRGQRGYIEGTINQQLVKIHRLIKDFPEGFEVDHIHGNRIDNRDSKLEIKTRQENADNLTAIRAKKKNGLVGAAKHHSGRWMCRAEYRGEFIWGGMFDTEMEAHLKYCEIMQGLGRVILPPL